MSAIHEVGTLSHAVTPALSMKQKCAARRKELESTAAVELPVPGYSDLDLWARYRVLGFEEVRTIGLKIEAETEDQATAERLTAAATLAEACIDLLEYKGKDEAGEPIFVNLDCRWSWTAGRDIFDLDIPEGVAAADVVTMVFPYPRDLLMVRHFNEYLEESLGNLPGIEEILAGESTGRSAETKSLS